ncbi:MAG: TCP-1/cpn60 chaperonin family protein [Anaerolineae bacterium]|nr:hypothetical protein [Thermoflexales bacterium]MDW8395906.1 TCP-1/cpn60 chaperonin family protein [Anaerolineae bacterium]
MPAPRNRANVVQRPAVVFKPVQVLEGIDLIADLVKPTLGPLPRLVMVEGVTRNRTPEVLDDAATIARRVIELAQPTVDVGAMMMRHAIWRMHTWCGDGGATMAVMAQAMLRAAVRAVAAGASPVMLRRELERSADQVCANLRAQARPAPLGPQRRTWLDAWMSTTLSDEELRRALIDLVAVLGDDAYINVYNNDPNRIDYEFLEGALWDAPWLSTGFTADPTESVARLQNAAVVVLDGALDTAENMVTLMRRLEAMGYRSAALIASELFESARTVLLQAKLRGLFHPLPIKTPYGGQKRATALHDIAALTGGRVLFAEGIPYAERLTREDVGEARRVWANARQFGIIAGRRDPIALRAIIAGVRRKMEQTADMDELNDLRRRLGQLTGSMGILRVGAPTQKVQEARRDTAERLSRALQLALRGGLVPGGGAALLKASLALAHEPCWGARCVAQALQAPMLTLAENAGLDGRALVARAQHIAAMPNASALGVDVRSGDLADMVERGVLDAVEILERAVRVATSLTVTALTTEVVVHHRKPASSTNP